MALLGDAEIRRSRGVEERTGGNWGKLGTYDSDNLTHGRLETKEIELRSS